MSLVLDGINQYLRRTWGITGTPLSFACWFKANDNDDSYPLIAADDGIEFPPNDILLLQAGGASEGDPIRAGSYAGSWALADSIAGYAANNWHHAGAVFASSTDRRAYLDGGSKGVDTTLMNPSGGVFTWIGSYKDASKCFAGKIAEAAIWYGSLNDAEWLQLGQGARPNTVQADNLLAYWKLLDDGNDYSIYSNHLTEFNSPTYDTEDHPDMGSGIISMIRHYHVNLLLG